MLYKGFCVVSDGQIAVHFAEDDDDIFTLPEFVDYVKKNNLNLVVEGKDLQISRNAIALPETFLIFEKV